MDTSVNPYKKLRESFGFTINQINLPEKTIRDLESFKYELINVKMHMAYKDVFGADYDGPKFVSEYSTRKSEIRKRLHLPSLKDVSFTRWKSGHPLYYYIRETGHTTSSFCDMILLREENLAPEKLRESKSMQSIIQEALLQCGMSSNDINTLSRMSRLFYMGELPHVIPENHL